MDKITKGPATINSIVNEATSRIVCGAAAVAPTKQWGDFITKGFLKVFLPKGFLALFGGHKDF